MNHFKKKYRIDLLEIFLSILFFLLGISLAHYLGSDVFSFYLFVGALWVISFQIGSRLLLAITPIDPLDKSDPGVFSNRNRSQLILWTMSILLSSGVFLFMIMIKMYQRFDLWILFILSYLSILLSVPIKKIGKGLLSVLNVVFQSCIVPGIGFLLFFPNYHKLLLILLFPLALMLLAIRIALEFSSFAKDESDNRKTLIRLFGWRYGILIHNILLACSIIMLVINIGRGIPSILLWPVLLTLPLIIGDIIWLHRIRLGYKPLWSFFNALNYSVVFVMLYLISYTLWIN